jgi:CIC family chloride channel protein
LIIIEMTGGYSLILPLMIANMLAYGIARHYRPTPIYEALLEQDGIHLRQKVALAEALDGIWVRQVPLGHRPYVMFAPSTGIAALLQAMSQNRRQEVFPIVENGRLVGIITLEDLLAVASQRELEGLVNAADLMRAPISVHQDESLRVAFETMLAQGVRELPATDGEGRVIGFVDETSIAHAYVAARKKAK